VLGTAIATLLRPRSNAGRWLAQHPDVHSHVISIEDAVASGRAVFGDVLSRT
jgi:hypothetical protein